MWFKSPTELNSSLPATTSGLSSVALTIENPTDAVVIKENKQQKAIDYDSDAKITDFFKRKRLLYTGVVNSASSLDDNFLIADTYFNLDPTVTSLFNASVLWRGDPVITVVYSGNPSLMGCVRVSFVPNNYFNTRAGSAYSLTNSITEFTRSSLLPHFDLDLSLSSTHTIHLPYPYPLDYSATADVNLQDWMCYVQEVNPMISAFGVTPADLVIQIFGYYENFQSYGLQAQGGQEGAPDGPVSFWIYTMSRLAALVPGGYVSGASQMLEYGSRIAWQMGYSRPPVESNEFVITKPVSNWAIAQSQNDGAQHLGVNPSSCNNMSHMQYPMGAPDDDSLYHHLQRYSQVFTNWDGAAFTVNPLQEFTTTPIVPTTLAYFTMPFTYWRGSIKFKLVFQGSPLVRWRFGVNVVPPGMATPTSFDGSGQLKSYVIDIVGSNEFEFVVPFLYEEPYVTVDWTSGTDVETRIVGFSLMEPQSQAPVTPKPYVNMYIAAGEDYSVARPNLSIPNRYLLAEGGVDEPPPKAASVFGEMITTLSLLAKKPAMVLYNITSANSGQTVSVPVDWAAPTLSLISLFGPEGYGWSYAGWFRQPFIGFNGTTVHRVVSPTLANGSSSLFMMGMQDTAVPGYFYDFAAGGLNGVTTGAVVNNGFMEFAPANDNNFNWKPTHFDPFDGDPWLCAIKLGTTSNQISHQYWFSSASDDFSVGGFISTPRIKLTIT